jgi:hypothetical protein
MVIIFTEMMMYAKAAADSSLPVYEAFKQLMSSAKETASNIRGELSSKSLNPSFQGSATHHFYIILHPQHAAQGPL